MLNPINRCHCRKMIYRAWLFLYTQWKNAESRKLLRSLLDFLWFSVVLSEFQWFSAVFAGFQQFSVVFRDFHWFFVFFSSFQHFLTVSVALMLIFRRVFAVHVRVTDSSARKEFMSPILTRTVQTAFNLLTLIFNTLASNFLHVFPRSAFSGLLLQIIKHSIMFRFYGCTSKYKSFIIKLNQLICQYTIVFIFYNCNF